MVSVFKMQKCTIRNCISPFQLSRPSSQQPDSHQPYANLSNHRALSIPEAHLLTYLHQPRRPANALARPLTSLAFRQKSECNVKSSKICAVREGHDMVCRQDGMIGPHKILRLLPCSLGRLRLKNADYTRQSLSTTCGRLMLVLAGFTTGMISDIARQIMVDNSKRPRCLLGCIAYAPLSAGTVGD